MSMDTRFAAMRTRKPFELSEARRLQTTGAPRGQTGYGRSYVPVSVPRANTRPAICFSNALLVATPSDIG